MTPQFILAKYAPDLNRMEPRNIGVFLWAKGEIVARFLDASDAGFVIDKSDYTEKVNHWLKLIQESSIKPMRGAAVLKKQPECLDALIATQEDNFILVHSGELLDSIPKGEINSAADFLFNDLVALRHSDREVNSQRSDLKSRCNKLFEDAGIHDRPGYRERFPVVCPVYGTRKPLVFNYGFGNGHPDALFQRVKLANDGDVHNAALMIHSSTDAAIIARKRCAVVVDSTPGDDLEEQAIDRIKRNLSFLETLCTAIDFSRPDEARDKLLSVAG